MRILLPIIALFLSLPAFAAKAVLQVTPDRPIVITADTVIGGRELKAPWFKVTVSLTNTSDQAVGLFAYQGQVDPTAAGTPDMVMVFPFPFGESLAPGASKETVLYFEGLPETNGFLYEVEFKVIGGGAPGSQDDIAEPVSFVTQ